VKETNIEKTSMKAQEMMQSLADEKYEARKIQLKQKMDRNVCENYHTKNPESDLFSDKNLLNIMMEDTNFSKKKAKVVSEKGLDVITKQDYINHISDFKKKVLSTKKDLEIDTIRENRR